MIDLQDAMDELVMDALERGCIAQCSPEELGEGGIMQLAEELWPDVEVGGPAVADEAMPGEAEAIEMWAERRMWAIRQLIAEQGKNDRQHAEITAPMRERMAMADRWRDEQNAALQRRIDYLTQQVEQAALAYPFDGKTKSRKMPAGTFGKRKVPERLDIIDKDATVAWAEAKGLTEAVRVTKAPDARKLREYFDSTGELPAGCLVEAEYEKPYCKVEG